MEIYFKSETIKILRKAGVKSPAFGDDGSDWRDREIDSNHLLPADFEIIKKIVKTEDLWKHIENKRVFRKLEAVESLMESGARGKKITKLEVLTEAIRKVMIEEAPNKWVFMNDEVYGFLSPFFMKNVRYHPPETRRDNYVPAHVTITLNAMARGASVDRTITYYTDDMPLTVEEALSKKEVFIETPKLVHDYMEDIKKYRKASPRTGEQYLASGRGYEAGGSRWHRGQISFEKDGRLTKIVMDDGLGQEKESGMESSIFWTGKKGKDDEDDDGVMVALPVHPIVQGFDLSIHEYVVCHIANLEEYQYDEKLIDKLVLPEDHRSLIDALTVGSVKRMDDIVKGKAQGVIILASGKPGTGKTLTAEVYSETIKRPLYMVQCSQLGTNEEKLEKLLTEVLDRATRWKAILLIDESDVYIHERGDDIQQNAIVGVFLRLLEYFNGILFLTTNRETIVDDAIVSRVTAHVRYSVPDNDEDKRRLWKILCTQYEVEASETFLVKAIDAFPMISGRSIRQLIRLGKFMADKEGKKVELRHIKSAAKFHDFTELESE
jgi:hypothetical protein